MNPLCPPWGERVLSHLPSPTELEELCNRTEEAVGSWWQLPHSSFVPMREGLPRTPKPPEPGSGSISPPHTHSQC